MHVPPCLPPYELKETSCRFAGPHYPPNFRTPYPSAPTLSPSPLHSAQNPPPPPDSQSPIPLSSPACFDCRVVYSRPLLSFAFFLTAVLRFNLSGSRVVPPNFPACPCPVPVAHAALSSGFLFFELDPFPFKSPPISFQHIGPRFRLLLSLLAGIALSLSPNSRTDCVLTRRGCSSPLHIASSPLSRRLLFPLLEVSPSPRQTWPLPRHPPMSSSSQVLAALFFFRTDNAALSLPRANLASA